MKNFYFILLVCSLSCAKGQTNTEILLNNTWYLQYLDFTEEFPSIIYPPDSDEFQPITLDFYMENDEIYFHTAACAFLDGVLNSINDMEIIYSTTNYSGEQTECTDPENNLFEGKYLGFFNIGWDQANFFYQIIEETDGSLTLYLGNSIFQGLSFSNQQLSNQEISQNSISTFPNPVQNKLTLENPNLKITKVKITDVKGNLILQQKINSFKTELDFSHFSQGIYFLTAESNGEILKTKKIIKK